MLTAWSAITAAAEPWLDALTVAAMRAPYPKRDGSPGGRIVGDLVQRTIYDDGFHLGQNVVVRKLSGHAPLPQIVGNIDAQASYVPETP